LARHEFDRRLPEPVSAFREILTRRELDRWSRRASCRCRGSLGREEGREGGRERERDGEKARERERERERDEHSYLSYSEHSYLSYSEHSYLSNYEHSFLILLPQNTNSQRSPAAAHDSSGDARTTHVF
jgi:hypothetical protein